MKYLKNLGLDNFTIRMNNRKILNGLFEDVNAKEISVDVMRIIDKIEKIGEEKVRAELRELQMPEQSIEKDNAVYWNSKEQQMKNYKTRKI